MLIIFIIMINFINNLIINFMIN